MGLVTQDSILFNDTIKNNVRLGKEDATDDEVLKALEIANAWEFVKDLPEGMDTNIGDSGNKLSGGQKQRLSIARAVLKNPPIMILDEATSASRHRKRTLGASRPRKYDEKQNFYCNCAQTFNHSKCG